MRPSRFQTTVFFAIALLISRPVLSCCAAMASGHSVDPVLSASSVAAPPCHGEIGDSTQLKTANASDAAECGGCIGCEDLTMQAQDALADLTSVQSEDAPITLGDYWASPILRHSIEPRAGPLPLLSWAHATPITLKQRLLI